MRCPPEGVPFQYRDMRRTGARCPRSRGRGALRLELEGVEGARALEDFLPFWKGEVCAFFCRSRRRGCAGNKPPMRKGRLGGMTHPCPGGQGYAAGVRDRRCLPLRGKSASELARLILGVSRGRAGRWGALPIRNGWQARRKNGKRAAIHADRVSKPPQAASPCSWGRQASTPSQRHWKPALPARRALPAPAQGINPLRIPFWGTAIPKNAAGGRPLLVGRPPSTCTIAPTGTKRSAQAPYSWGLGASTSSRRLLAVGPADRPAAEADLALVEYGRLTGGDGALGRVERYARFVSMNDRARGL